MNDCFNNDPSDEISRRAIIKSAAAFGLGVTTMVGGNAFAAKKSYVGRGRKRVVRVFLSGGLSHIDSFDPKVEKPEVQGPTQVVRTNTGELIGSTFKELGQRMDKIALIRSMTSPDADHERSAYIANTSYQSLGTTRHPNLGAWMHKLKGSISQALPASVSIDNSHLSSGFLGAEYDVFCCQPENPLEGLIMDDPNSEKATAQLQLITNLRKGFHKKFPHAEVDAYRSFYNDAVKFMRSKDIDAFDISLEDPATKTLYDVTHGDSFLLARRLLQSGVQFVNVNLPGWDMHSDLWANLNGKAPAVDKAMVIFMDDLQRQGLWEDTIVMFTTEFGRSPEIDVNKGRTHNNKAFSSFLAGGSIRAGQVYGKTSEDGRKAIENPVSHMDYNATVAKIMGLSLTQEIFSPDNRPFTVSRDGVAVDDLIA
jgi:hypothetical protein